MQTYTAVNLLLGEAFFMVRRLVDHRPLEDVDVVRSPLRPPAVGVCLGSGEHRLLRPGGMSQLPLPGDYGTGVGARLPRNVPSNTIINDIDKI